MPNYFFLISDYNVKVSLLQTNIVRPTDGTVVTKTEQDTEAKTVHYAKVCISVDIL